VVTLRTGPLDHDRNPSFQSLSRDSWWSHCTYAPGPKPHCRPSEFGANTLLPHIVHFIASKTLSLSHSLASCTPLLRILRALILQSKF